MNYEHETIKGISATGQLFIGDKEILPGPSQKICNHSPDGFSWGYGGSGPAQVGLAILLELFGAKTAIRFYQQFKWDFIANVDQEKDFEIDVWEVKKWLKEHGG